MVTSKKSQPARRATGMSSSSRVTNQDLNDRLIRMEESIKPVAEGMGRLGILQEGHIRTEGALKDHDGKISVLFDKAKDTEAKVDSIKQKDLPSVNSKVDTGKAAARAVMGTLAVVVGIVMTVIGYFVSQQADKLKDISDNTTKTAAVVISLDKRLTVAEYELGRISAAPASNPDTSQSNK